MSHILRMVTAIVMLAFAATDVARARHQRQPLPLSPRLRRYGVLAGTARVVAMERARARGRRCSAAVQQSGLANRRLRLPRPPGLWPVRPALLLTPVLACPLVVCHFV
jgi:hypothetical protein